MIFISTERRSVSIWKNAAPFAGLTSIKPYGSGFSPKRLWYSLTNFSISVRTFFRFFSTSGPQ